MRESCLLHGRSSSVLTQQQAQARLSLEHRWPKFALKKATPLTNHMIGSESHLRSRFSSGLIQIRGAIATVLKGASNQH